MDTVPTKEEFTNACEQILACRTELLGNHNTVASVNINFINKYGHTPTRYKHMIKAILRGEKASDISLDCTMYDIIDRLDEAKELLESTHQRSAYLREVIEKNITIVNAYLNCV